MESTAAIDEIAVQRTEEALSVSEDRFRMLADNMSQLAWTCDRLGNVTWYNQRWLDYTGLSFDDMKGWGWSKVQHPDHLAHVVARIERSSRTGEPWEDTFPLRGKDGSYRWFLSRALPMRDETGEIVCWFGTNTDIDDQKRTEESLRKVADAVLTLRPDSPTSGEAVLQVITEQVRELIGCHQSVTSLTDGENWSQAINALSLSDKYAAWRGYVTKPDGSGIYALVVQLNKPIRLTQAELEAHPAWKNFGREAQNHPPMRGWLAVPLVGVEGQTIGLIQLSDRYEGEFTPEDEAILVQYAQTAAGVLENQRLYRRVRESEERYRTLVEQVKEHAIFGTDIEGRATTWNEGVRRVLGFEEAEFVGKDIEEEIFTPQDIQSGVAKRELGNAAAMGSASDDRWMMRKDGTRFWAAGITTARRDDHGQLIGFTKVMRDMTAQKTLEDELRQVATELSDANRRKDEFLATLAHELRNPLAPMRNMLEIMKRTDDDRDLLQQVRDTMERQLGQLVRLVDDLLDVSRISRGKIDLKCERVELAAIVYQAVEASRPMAANSKHNVSVTVPPHPIYVYGDPIRLAQVVGNLLNNACKFTDAGGQIWLTVEQDADQAVIRVRDTGIGLAGDELRRIFEMFAQVDKSLERARDGLGLGLALVKKLVELHDGAVEATSPGLGMGSEFVVRLPVASGSLPAPPRESADGKPAATNSRRILVVDDNRDSANSLAMLLKVMGHEVDTANDGLEAISRVATFRADVILLDIGMPRLNGYEAARRIRNQNNQHGLRIVALTGLGQEDDRRRSEKAGFDAHLVKPVDLKILTKLLAEWGEG
jgi:two-component system CheB/CheR fusion protein